MAQNNIVNDVTEVTKLVKDDIKDEIATKVNQQKIKSKISDLKHEFGEMKEDLKDKAIETIEKL